MTTIHLVTDEEAAPEVREVFEDVKRYYNLDFVPNVFRAMAHRPEELVQQWQGLKQAETEVGKELIYVLSLAVDVTRNCSYCINFDTAVLKHQLGYSDARIEGLINMIALMGMYNTYVQGLNLDIDVTPEVMGRRMAA